MQKLWDAAIIKLGQFYLVYRRDIHLVAITVAVAVGVAILV